MPARTAASQRRAPLLLPLAVAASACLMLCSGAGRAFVLPPARAAPSTPAVATSAALAAGLVAPLAARAELPPLEDLPLDELKFTRTLAAQTETFFGLNFQMALGFVLFAVCWAAFWVTNLTPKKDEDGVYKTYVGAGELPPEGYTNPLDPRISEEYADEEDPLFLETKKGKGERSASSAIV